MSYFYEEDFYEPSEFEVMFDELKQGLLKSVKEDYISEMERLKKENEELQGVKENFEQIKRDFDCKKRELEYEYQDLKSKVRRERMVDLLKEHKVVLYKAYSKRELPPKCDKCNKHRKIEYISPLGRKTSEDCLCNEGKTVYNPTEYVRYEFRLNRDKNGVTAWYRQYSDDEDGLIYDNSIHAEKIYSPNMVFEDLKSYSTFFKSEEECQAYCDWLNENKSE